MTYTTKTIKNARLDDILPNDIVVWEFIYIKDDVAGVDRREGVAHHQDKDGDWYTEYDRWITDGEGEGVIITITRTVKELPTVVGTVLVPINPDEPVEAVIAGTKYYTNETVYGPDGKWHGIFRSDTTVLGFTWSEYITPGKWKIKEK